jgi:phospho-N-acetylmuramoyl-pentapeptide-transferase
MVNFYLFLEFVSFFLIGVCLQNLLIWFSKKFKLYQTIRAESPYQHLIKKDTPTLGGLGMVAVLIAAVLFYRRMDFDFIFLVSCACGFAFLGLVDDLLLLSKIGKRGLVGRFKFSLQLILAAIFARVLLIHGNFVSIGGLAAFLGFNQPALYFILAILLMIATVNSVNLTDGLDGLAAGVTLPILWVFLYFSLKAGNLGAVTVSFVVSLAVLSFLIFNLHPARIFMGDTGSHFLGGVIAALALILHKELLLIVIGGVLVAEALSVIIQVGSYKLFHRRVFKMSPLHHHFELLGWSEQRVVYFFWFLSAIFAFLAAVFG